MLMPSIFGENLLDDFFDYPFGRSSTFDMMNTDIKDTQGALFRFLQQKLLCGGCSDRAGHQG